MEDPNVPYRDSFDLDGGTISAPQAGGPTRIQLGPAVDAGSRLSMAVIRDGALWTCHYLGADGVDGDYDEEETGSSVDRPAIQWLTLHITEEGGLELQSTNDWGRIWDSPSSHPTNPSRAGVSNTTGPALAVRVPLGYRACVADEGECRRVQ